MLLTYRVIILLITIIILFFFINNSMDIITKIIIILLLHSILYSDYYSDYYNEYFGNTINTTSNHQIQELNKDRGTLGNFYVNCHKCGRDRILEDKQNIKQHVCISNANQHKIEDSMSYDNNKYISNENQCYNCLLDNNNLISIRNYKDFPYVNGSPGTNFYTH